MLIGQPGMGKSSFCAEWPGVRFCIDPRDEGIINLLYEGLLPKTVQLDHILRCVDYTGYKNNLTKLINDPNCRTIVCESVIGIQNLCWDHCSRTDHGGDTGPRSFLNFQAGPIQADYKYFKELTDMMQQAQNMGKHVILTGHTESKEKENVEGEDWLQATLAADKRFAKRIGVTFQNIFHITDLVALEGKKGDHKAGGFQRFVFTTAQPKYFAKNQMGLSMGFIFSQISGREAFLGFCSHCKRDPKTCYRLRTAS